MTRLKYLFLFLLFGYANIITSAYGLEGITDPAQIPAENFFKENTEFVTVYLPTENNWRLFESTRKPTI
jgi:hypothetical protein